MCIVKYWALLSSAICHPSPPSALSSSGKDRDLVHRAVASGALDALIPMLRSPSSKEREVTAKVRSQGSAVMCRLFHEVTTGQKYDE